jgi:hypothetical protein
MAEAEAAMREASEEKALAADKKVQAAKEAVAQARAAKAVNVIDCSSLIRALRTKITGKPIFAVACFQFLGVSSAPSFLNRGINLFLRVVIIAEQTKVTEIAVNTE